MSERVRAMSLALAAAERRRTGKPAPYAICRSCGAPLISTMAFSGFEFYCLECGNHYGFVQPDSAPETPELTDRYNALKAEWDEHAGTKLLIRGWYGWCKQCEARGPYHTEHATEREREAHEQAMACLAQRAGKAAGSEA